MTANSNALADVFIRELERLEATADCAAVSFLGRDLAKQHKEQQNTLASIATMYVKTYKELEDLKKLSSAGRAKLEGERE